MISEWMKVMLGEIDRKKVEAEQGRAEDRRRSQERQGVEERQPAEERLAVDEPQRSQPQRTERKSPRSGADRARG
jgi:hypothetical protein